MIGYTNVPQPLEIGELRVEEKGLQEIEIKSLTWEALRLLANEDIRIVAR